MDAASTTMDAMIMTSLSCLAAAAAWSWSLEDTSSARVLTSSSDSTIDSKMAISVTSTSSCALSRLAGSPARKLATMVSSTAMNLSRWVPTALIDASILESPVAFSARASKSLRNSVSRARKAARLPALSGIGWPMVASMAYAVCQPLRSAALNCISFAEVCRSIPWTI